VSPFPPSGTIGPFFGRPFNLGRVRSAILSLRLFPQIQNVASLLGLGAHPPPQYYSQAQLSVKAGNPFPFVFLTCPPGCAPQSLFPVPAPCRSVPVTGPANALVLPPALSNLTFFKPVVLLTLRATYVRFNFPKARHVHLFLPQKHGLM